MAVGDWDRRELCPDGNCTGLIGPEGTCKVCGRAASNWGDERKRGMTTKAEDDPDDDEEDDDEYEDEDEDEEPDPVQPGTPVEIGEWTKRTLCSDGSCVGVIGSDGKCKTCGKSADPAADDDEDDDEDEDDESAEFADEDDQDESDDEEDGDDEDGDGDEDEDDDDDELAAAAADLAGVATHSEVAAAKDVASAAKGSKTAKADDDENRQLCPDGGCIGVIGADGKCKVCGKEAA